MEYKGFVGGAYRAQARIAAADECINWYPERLEVANPKSAVILIGTPGLAVFCALPTAPVQGICQFLGRVFAVSGSVLYEVFSNGTYANRGALKGNGPAIFTCNTVQLVVVLAGSTWVMGLATNALTNVTPILADADVASVGTLAFLDGYTIVSLPGTRQFNISALYDATSWSALDFALKEGGPDNLITVIANVRNLWLLGEKTSEVWWNSGNGNFPLQYIQGSFMETGCAAKLSPTRFDNTIAWLGRDERGQGMVFRANGYTPQRISTHALEFAISQYPRIDDAVGSSHQYLGHEYYRLDFPSAKPALADGTAAGETWLYDAATQLWHQRAFWNPQAVRYEAHRGRYYCFGFGQHLVGDYASGNIYSMSAQFLDDFGNPLRSQRTAPHQYSEGRWIIYHWYLFDIAVGQGLPGGAAAQAALQLSNDGGYTFGNEMYQSLGPIGAYKQRVKFRRAARARDRVCRLIISDPIQRVLVGAYFDATAGTS